MDKVNTVRHRIKWHGRYERKTGLVDQQFLRSDDSIGIPVQRMPGSPRQESKQQSPNASPQARLASGLPRFFSRSRRNPNEETQLAFVPGLQGRRIQRVDTRLQVPVLSDVGQLTGAVRIRSDPTPGVPAQASGAQVTPMRDGPGVTATRRTGRLPRIALAGIA